MFTYAGITIIDAVLNIFRSDASNYFIVQHLQSLSYFVEKITEKNEDVQVRMWLFEQADDMLVTHRIHVHVCL